MARACLGHRRRRLDGRQPRATVRRRDRERRRQRDPWARKNDRSAAAGNDCDRTDDDELCAGADDDVELCARDDPRADDPEQPKLI